MDTYLYSANQVFFFFFSSRRRHTRLTCDWSSDVCSSDLVEWVRLMETPEVQPRAGDLMFTSGFPIKDDLDAQIRLVGRIAEGGGAGLVVRPLPYLRKLPPEMVTEADRLKVPLFTIPSDVQFVDLMSPLLERIINAEHWRLKRSMEIHRRFTELVLDGKGVNEICRTLAEILESAVV